LSLRWSASSFCFVFLLYLRSALVAILMLPVDILMAFGRMKLIGLGSNIMSLGGITIVVRAMIDATVVMIENAPQASGTRHARQAAQPNPDRCSKRRRPGAVLQPPRHHGVVPADHARITGRAALRTACFHQDFLDGGRGAAVGDPGPDADGNLRSRGIIPEHRNPINKFLVFAVLNGTMALVRPNAASPGHRADLGL
jgi:hypothetical protein